MPNYSYECQDCHHRFDIRASIQDMEKGQFLCENCGSNKTKRIYNGFGYCPGNGSVKTGHSSCSTCSGGSCSTCHH